MRHFVKETLHRKGIGRVSRRPPGAASHAGLHRKPLETQIGQQLRRKIVRIQLRGPQLIVGHVGTSIVLAGAGQAVCPTTQSVLIVERGDQVVMAERPVEIMVEIIFARPQQPDRLSAQLRQNQRFGDEVVAQTPSEAAADAGHLHINVETVHAGDLLGQARRTRGHLHRRDDAYPIALHVHAGILRLQRTVRDIGHPIDRFDHLGRRLSGAIEVAILTAANPFAFQQFTTLLIQCSGGFIAPGTRLPFDLQRLAAFQG